MGRHTVEPDPFNRFEAEHDEALRVLQRLEYAAAALERGERPEPHLEVVREAHSFVTTTVRAHNDNEERALFDLLNVLDQDAPVAVFIDEHRVLRELERNLGSALGSDHPAANVPEAAQVVIAFLRDHIERENEMLFPLARTLLGPKGVALVGRRLTER